VKTHYSSPNAIIGKLELEEFWTDRWWRQNLPSTDYWNRMFAFAEQYPPRRPMPRTQFQLDGGWKSISDTEPPLHAGQIA